MTPFMETMLLGENPDRAGRGTGGREELPSRRGRTVLRVERKHEDEHRECGREGDDQAHLRLPCFMDETICPPS
jgi:hypothetical protein